jgi:arylsulfatase A-like enzyme/Tfp pilus assembly protein PilF
MSRRRVLLPAAALGLAVLAAGAALSRVRSAPRPVVREPGLDVLLVTIDTLRADALGCYGNPRAQTPWIDRLAGAGVRFAEAQAHNVVTLPSHANILTGRLPLAHGVRDNAGFRLPADVETLATVLRGQGYRTGAFVSAFTLDSRFGLDRGFDVYDDDFASGTAPVAFELPERGGAETVAAARRWLDQADGRPSFAWVHLYDPHAPYVPPAPFAARFAALPYLGEVAAADAALEPLLGPLLAAGAAARTLVVLTADHGESLGEHGERTHGIFAYEGTLRVPLILYAPRLLRPRVAAVRAQHVDLMPTVLDALGLAAPAGLSGRSLLAAAGGARSPDAGAYFEALSGQTTRGWAPLFGLVRGGWKYVDLPLPELFDLARDPREEKNLAAARPRERDELRAALQALRAGDRGAGAARESGETRERLRALGYLTAATPAADRTYTADDDPKRLIELDALIETVLARHRAGDLVGALALCEEVVRRRPGMPSALLQLALLRRKTGQLLPAIRALEEAVAAAPDDEGTAALLGSYLNEAGRAREAERLLEPFARRAPPALDVLVARGIALSQLGRHADAAASLAAAVEADPSNAMTRVQLGTVRLLARDLGGARAALAEALRLDAGLAVAHRTLGLVAEAAGDDEEALRCWRAAVAIDPQEHDALLRLGAALARRGRRDEARAYLERFVATAPAAVYGRALAGARAWLQGSVSR